MDVLPLLIVDFGGVLYHIEFERTRQALMALPGYNGAPVMFDVDDQDDLFMQVDRGIISDTDFTQALSAKFGFDASHERIITAWNAVLVEPYATSVATVQAMRAKARRLVLLSNISNPHWTHCSPQCNAFLGQFDALYLSYRLHQRKPDADILESVLAAEGIDAADAMFIDDSVRNCATARGLGIGTLRVEDASLLAGQVAAMRFARGE